jgi:hypothetical protein
MHAREKAIILPGFEEALPQIQEFTTFYTTIPLTRLQDDLTN